MSANIYPLINGIKSSVEPQNQDDLFGQVTGGYLSVLVQVVRVNWLLLRSLDE
jgi:hypothetical protein